VTRGREGQDGLEAVMDCGTARKLVDDLLDGRLSINREAELRAHADSCPECSAALGAADAMAAEVSASFRSALGAAPSDMPGRVMKAVALARAEDRPWRPRHRRIALIAGAAAAVGAAVAAAVVMAFSLPPGPVPADDPVPGELAATPAPKATASPLVEVATLAAGELDVRRAGSEEIAALKTGAALAAGDFVRAAGDTPCELLLADGSRIFLNSGAEGVMAPAGGGARAIRLDIGGLFAEIEKDAEPFIVDTALGRVTTLGTKFGVSLDPPEGSETGETELAVVVEEGAVRVDGDAGRRVVEAGKGCVYGGGRKQCEIAGEQRRRRFGWMKRHRERCRRECTHGDEAQCRCERGDSKTSQGRGRGRAEAGSETHRSGAGHGAGSGNGRAGGAAKGQGECGRSEEKRRAEEKLQAQERARAAERKRAEEKRRAEERQRAEERKRAEEQKRAEQQKRDEEKRSDEQRRRDDAKQGGGGQGRGSGGGSGGGGNGGGGRRGR